MRLFNIRKRYIALFCILAIIACASFVYFKGIYRPEHPIAVLQTDKGIILVDDCIDKYKIVKLSGNIKEAEFEIDKAFDGWTEKKLQAIYEDGGRVYIQFTAYDNLDLYMEIYSLNLEENMLYNEDFISENELYCLVYEGKSLYNYIINGMLVRIIDGVQHIYGDVYEVKDGVVDYSKGYIYDVVMDSQHTINSMDLYEADTSDRAYKVINRYRNGVFLIDEYGRHYIYDFSSGTVNVIYGSEIICETEEGTGKYICVDKLKEDFFTVSLSGGSAVLSDYGVPAEECFNNITAYDIGDIEAISENNGLLSILCSRYDRSAIIQMDSDGNTVEYDYWLEDKVPVIIIKCVVLLCILAASEVIVTAIYTYSFKRGGILTKLTVVLLPIVLLLVLTVYLGTAYWYMQISKKGYREVLAEQGNHLAVFNLTQCLDGKSFELDRYDNTNDTLFEETVKAIHEFCEMVDGVMDVSDTISEISDSDIEFRTEVDYLVIDGDKAYNCYLDNWSTDIKTLLSREEEDLVRSVVDNKKTIYYTGWIFGRGCSYYALVPEISPDGDVIGVYCVFVMMQTILNEVADFLNRFLVYEILYMVVIMADFYILAIIYIYPFKKLKKNVRKIMNGNKSVRLKKHLLWYDESDIVSLLLDNMLSESYKNLDELARLIKADETFFDVKKLKLVNKKYIGQLSFDESIVGEYYVTNIVLPESYADIARLEDFIKTINPVLTVTESALFARDGVLVWQAVSKSEKAIDLAIAIMNYDEKIELLFDKSLLRISVTGAGESYRFCAEYEERDRVQEINERLSGMGVGFAASEGAVKGQKRRMAYSSVAMYNGEFLYEMKAAKYITEKKLTQRLMEQSVVFFEQGQYTEARNGFIKTLKYYPDNSVALYYVRKIDSMVNC